MQFGPLELEACGENNFTMKALGLLAFRPDLRRRFVERLFALTLPNTTDVEMLFFSRIGEGFFREAIGRLGTDTASINAFMERANTVFGLPRGFRWSRNGNGQLTQPAKWNRGHIGAMLTANGRPDDSALRVKLDWIQDVLNTEPDVVLRWDEHVALVEIKVLSGEGNEQLPRQREQAAFLQGMLGWTPHLALIARDQPTSADTSAYTFRAWRDVAAWFEDEPFICQYIREFAFYYRGTWQSMIASYVEHPSGETAYERACARMPPTPRHMPFPPTLTPQPTPTPTPPPTTPTPSNPWHHSHLGRAYFEPIFRDARSAGVWPLRTVWTGVMGTPYPQLPPGRRHPNWMVEDEQGNRWTNKGRFSAHSAYDPGHMREWSVGEILRAYNITIT